jgi:hypothetical protein
MAYNYNNIIIIQYSIVIITTIIIETHSNSNNNNDIYCIIIISIIIITIIKYMIYIYIYAHTLWLYSLMGISQVGNAVKDAISAPRPDWSKGVRLVRPGPRFCRKRPDRWVQLVDSC